MIVLKGQQPDINFQFLNDLDRDDGHISDHVELNHPNDIDMDHLLGGYPQYLELAEAKGLYIDPTHQKTNSCCHIQ